MATTDVAICNMALAEIGVSQQIANLTTEKGNEARVCNLYYGPMRDAVLEDYDWPFASARATLALLDEQPNSDWGYSYRKPGDCLRAIKIDSGIRQETSPIPFQEGTDDSGGLIFTDQSGAVLKYTRRITNPALFSSAFADALSLRLAAKIAGPLGRRKNLQLEKMREYQLQISQAGANAQNQNIDYPPLDSEFNRVRS